MDKNTNIEIRKRLIDLSNRSYQNNQYTFSDFLGMADLSEFYEICRGTGKGENPFLPGSYTAWGGYLDSERSIIRFGNEGELGYEMPFPICCINIKPLQKKFADELSHRDFLGALINLGIERTGLGDILVKDKECFLFAKESLAELICRELTRVKHTTVMAKVCDFPEQEFKPTLVDENVQVSSLRIDGFLAKILKISRNASSELFFNSKVYVNGRQMNNESYLLKEDDIISVRGYGKYIFRKSVGHTKKGNHIVEYSKYI